MLNMYQEWIADFNARAAGRFGKPLALFGTVIESEVDEVLSLYGVPKGHPLYELLYSLGRVEIGLRNGTCYIGVDVPRATSDVLELWAIAFKGAPVVPFGSYAGSSFCMPLEDSNMVVVEPDLGFCTLPNGWLEYRPADFFEYLTRMAESYANDGEYFDFVTEWTALHGGDGTSR